MQVIIEATSTTSVEPIVLDDRLQVAPWARNAGVIGLERDGLDGWFDSLTPSADLTEIPTRNGSYWPGRVTLKARVLTIRGFYRAPSTLAAEAFRDRLAALAGEELRVTVVGASGPRIVTGILTDEVASDRKNWRDTKFSLVVTCPDPIKYGPTVTVTLDKPGSVTVENTGTAPVPFQVTTRATKLSATVGGRTVTWTTGSSEGMVRLDTSTMLGGHPSTGSAFGWVITPYVVMIPPGQSTLKVAVTAASPSSIIITHPSAGWK